MGFKFPSIDKYVTADDVVVTSNANSKEYVNIPKLMMTYGPGLLGALRMRRPILPKMIGCMMESRKSSSSIVRNPNQGKTFITQEERLALEAYIKSFDIDSIGYTTVSPSDIFLNHKILYGNAIVLVMPMRKEAMISAPSKTALKEVFRTYYGLGVTVNKIADYLRSQGFNAMAGPAIGGDASYVPIAQKAGLGVIGRHGLLITDKDYGPSLRIAMIYTDIENLPVATENKHLWVREFCKQCGKCVRSCPANAIYNETTPSGRAINQTLCAVPFANNFGCSVCIKSCIFFSHDYEKIKANFLK